MTEEIWKDIPGHPNYQASSLGNIRSITTRRYNRLTGQFYDAPGRVLKPGWKIARGGKRYLKVCMGRGKGAQQMVHRLVCLAFYGEPPDGKRVACHLNDDGMDNRADNLKWGSHAWNCQMRGKVGQQDIRLPAEGEVGDAWEPAAGMGNSVEELSNEI